MMVVYAAIVIASVALIVWALSTKHAIPARSEAFVALPQAYIPDLTNSEQAGYIAQLQTDYSVPLTYADTRYIPPTPQPQYLSATQAAYEGYAPFDQAGVSELQQVEEHDKGVIPFIQDHDRGNVAKGLPGQTLFD
jgi:hypothetical protein